MENEHFCAMGKPVHPLTYILPRDGLWAKMKYYWYKMVTVSISNPRAASFFSSHSDFVGEIERHMQNFRYSIHPFSTLRVIWEILMVFGFLAAYIQSNIIAIGIMGCLITGKAKSIEREVLQAYLILSALQVLDIVANCMTGIPVNADSSIILERRLILRNYLKGRFTLDVISALPLTYLLFSYGTLGSPMMVGAFLVNFKTIINIRSVLLYFKNTCQVFRIGITLVRFLTIFLVLFLFLNWMTGLLWVEATLFKLYTSPEETSLSTWADKWGLWAESTGSKYFEGIYLVTVIIFKCPLVLIGDATFVGTIENSLVAFVLLVGNIFWFLLIGQVYVFVKGWNSSERKYETIKMIIKHHLENSPGTEEQKRVAMRNFELQYGGTYFDAEKMIGIIGESMKKKLLYIKCEDLLKHIPFLKDMDRKDLEQIASKLTFEAYAKGEVIYEEGSYGTLIYFILKGSVHLFYKGEKILEAHDGDEFGEFTVITKSAVRLTSAVAVADSTMYCIHYQAVNAVLTRYPSLADAFKKTMGMKRAMLFAKYRPPSDEGSTEEGRIPRKRRWPNFCSLF